MQRGKESKDASAYSRTGKLSVSALHRKVDLVCVPVADLSPNSGYVNCASRELDKNECANNDSPNNDSPSLKILIPVDVQMRAAVAREQKKTVSRNRSIRLKVADAEKTLTGF